MEYWLQYQPLGYTSHDRSPAGLCTTDNNPLRPAIQPVFSPLHGSLIWSVLHQFVCEDAMEGSVENIAKVKMNYIHAVSFSHHLDSRLLNWIPGYAIYLWSCQDNYLRKLKYFVDVRHINAQKSILQVVWIAWRIYVFNIYLQRFKKRDSRHFINAYAALNTIHTGLRVNISLWWVDRLLNVCFLGKQISVR